MKKKILCLMTVMAGILCACSSVNKVSEAKNRQVIYGDVDQDGDVTADDALAVLKHVVKLTTIQEGLSCQIADMDGDGELAALDALEILKTVVKLIPPRVCKETGGTESPIGTETPPAQNDNEIPEELKTIPETYFSPADRQGTLVDLYYDTYESFSYEEKTQPLQKHAVVYLPDGYDETKQYNIFYLMHGGWGNENQTLGAPDHPSGFKNVIDNAIANGDFDPLIIVCPTYNNTSPEDSASFSLALQLNRNYHNELVNDLMPAVEGKYSTYAQDTTPEALAASRDHRGFGGFFMGSVATWRTFQNCLDYFHYFLPMSCGTSLDDETIFKAAEEYSQNEYFVWVMTGTNDFAYSYENDRVEKMRSSDYFTEGNTEQEGNFAYRVKEGYDHGGTASMEYTYNGL